MSAINIMQVVQSLRAGGLERVVLDLVNHSGPEFHFVICCLEEAGDWAERLNRSRGRVVALRKRPGIDWRLVGQIARLAKSEQVRLIHSHNAQAHFYGALGGWLAKVKVMHTEHHPKLGAEEKRVNRVNRFAARFTDFSVAVSPRLGQIALAHEGARAERFAVIPNGIHVEAYEAPVAREELRRELGLPLDAKLIGSIGRLVAQKNHALLLEAFKPLADKRAEVFLVIAGDGHLRASLEQQRSRLQLTRRVFLLGNRTDVPKLLGSFDLFALSSDNEGHPIALLEAMAAACPCVVTKVPGNEDLIRDGSTGLLVPPRDAAALTRALERLLDGERFARQLGIEARREVRARYSVQQMCRQYETLWRQLAGVSAGQAEPLAALTAK
jgi:glycosyltransferase involved in cell wall biosynthesis